MIPAGQIDRKASFQPVVSAETRLLILGSLPGEESLRRAQYYANPRNQFWRLIGDVADRDFSGLPYEERLSAIRDARIGLWDVVASATRTGSLDTAIRDHETNDLAALAGDLSALRAVAFNGGKAAALGMKALAGTNGLALITLPSSSPALTWPYERKSEAWMQLRAFL